MVSTVAVCAGSGASVLSHAGKVDLWITGEMGHHEALDAQENNTSVILAEHSNTERGFLESFKAKLMVRQQRKQFYFDECDFPITHSSFCQSWSLKSYLRITSRSKNETFNLWFLMLTLIRSKLCRRKIVVSSQKGNKNSRIGSNYLMTCQLLHSSSRRSYNKCSSTC